MITESQKHTLGHTLGYTYYKGIFKIREPNRNWIGVGKDTDDYNDCVALEKLGFMKRHNRRMPFAPEDILFSATKQGEKLISK